MAYSENIDGNGLLTRKYFGLDSSGIFKMYYNGKLVKFPTKELPMGKENVVTLSIDLKRFVKNFILRRAYIRIRYSNSYLRDKLIVYKSKTITSNNLKEVGVMEKEKQGYFVFDVTELLINQLNTRLNLCIKTKSRVNLYSLFAFYGKKAEFVIEYYDDSFKSDNNLILKNKNNRISVNTLNGINVIEKNLTQLGLIDLKIVFNNHLKTKLFRFNYEGFIYGGINNFKYIDEFGIKHYFKLKEENFKTHYDVFSEDIILESGRNYLIKKPNQKLIFNDKGYLIEKRSNKGIIFITYDINNNILLIKDSFDNEIHFTYLKNKILISNSKNKKVIKIIFTDSYVKINKTKYLFDKNKNLISFKDIKFKYDSVNRLKKIVSLKKEYKINYKKKEGIKK